ncbi:MAG: aminotransferase class IV [Planctomycetota bacterium]|nr:aminotransferase class IV [Planctomycetota bacterium]
MPDKVFLNEKLIDIDKACISITDGGFLYGAGLFETMRSHDGVVFALADHLDRLFFSARNLSINNPYNKEYITDAVYKVLRANKLSDARMRLTFTSGPMVESEQDRRPTLLITAAKFRSYPAEYYKNGVLVVLCPFRQNPHDPTCGHKTTSYYSRMIALNTAHQRGAAEALWFTVDNHLAEGCVSNVFLVKDSVLYTPSIETPVLAGVARKTVCQLALKNSIELIEKDLTINDVLGADELFLTNVIMQVMPITKVEKHKVGDGKVGPTVIKLQRSFAEFVENECEKHRSSD